MALVSLNIVENEFDEIEESERQIPNCYFERDNNHFHPEGTCIHCDWKKQMLKSKGWDDSDFIEWWDYEPYWQKNVRKTEKAICE